MLAVQHLNLGTQLCIARDFPVLARIVLLGDQGLALNGVALRLELALLSQHLLVRDFLPIQLLARDGFGVVDFRQRNLLLRSSAILLNLLRLAVRLALDVFDLAQSGLVFPRALAVFALTNSASFCAKSICWR
jgi:hypothetical protein